MIKPQKQYINMVQGFEYSKAFLVCSQNTDELFDMKYDRDNKSRSR